MVDKQEVNEEPDEHAPPAAVDEPNAQDAQLPVFDTDPHPLENNAPWYHKEVHLSFPILGLLLATIAFAVYVKLFLPY